MHFKSISITICFFFFLSSVKSKEITSVNSTIACGSEQPLVVTQKLGYLSSPKFDNFHYYPPNQNCSWTLKAPEGKAFLLQKMHFGLNMECNTDVLNLFDGEPPNHKIVDQFCGQWAPSRYESKSNIFHLNFISGRTPRSLGFDFFFQQVDATVIICRHKTKCFPQSKKCDGIDDCGDGTDEEKCGGNNISSNSCGVPTIAPILESSRIVGGKNAAPGSWPWQAYLSLIQEEPFGHWCDGTLINQQWIVTSAQCFQYDNLDIRKWNVLLGKHFRDVPDDTEQVRYMESIFIHPEYKAFNDSWVPTSWLEEMQHDLALIKLNAPVTFTDYISPVCLPTPNYTIPDGKVCYVTGWGNTFGTEMELKQAVVPISSLEQCKKFFQSFDMLPSMVCAGHAEGGPNTCQGRSGGPLVYADDKKVWHLAGVVLTGLSTCVEQEQIGLYTLVPYYIDWIEATIKQNT